MRTKELLQGVIQKNRLSIAKAITLIESSKAEHRVQAAQLLQELPVPTTSLRIGICGSPGTGKSSLIESLGLSFIAQGFNPAVLVMDPSSVQFGGSILGDKTRMPLLSTSPKAYIRPSPTKGVLGGVTSSCSETVLICEAAGYSPVIIETVGLGQSETTVDEVADLIVLLTSPAGGDSLQGIKKGIMEIADIIVVNKADGAWMEAAKQKRVQLEQAVHLNLNKYEDWTVPIILTSAAQNVGIHELAGVILRAKETLKDAIRDKRTRQVNMNCSRMVEDLVRTRIKAMRDTAEYGEQMKLLRKHQIVPRVAALNILNLLIK